jgi:hypothetical protein
MVEKEEELRLLKKRKSLAIDKSNVVEINVQVKQAPHSG